MSTPAGQFSYLYDAAGQATSLTNPFGETTGWSYRDNGWLQTQTLGNGVTSTYVQNALGQLTSLLNQTGGGTLLSQFSGMVHDGAGNRLSVPVEAKRQRRVEPRAHALDRAEPLAEQGPQDR